MQSAFLLPRRLLMLPLTASLLALVAFSPPARAQGSETVSLGPGLLTFEDIAAKLSTPQQPIRCRASAAHRAAFVCLKNRTRDEARAILAAGLDVSFRNRSDPHNRAGLVMEEDPDTARRERRWRGLLADNLLRVAETGWREREAASRLSEEVRAAQEQETQKALAALEAKKDPADLEAIRTLRQKASALMDRGEYVPFYREGRSFVGSHFRSDAIIAAFDRGGSYRFDAITAAPSAAITPQLEEYRNRIKARVGEGETLYPPMLMSGWRLRGDAYAVRLSLFVSILPIHAQTPEWTIPFSLEVSYYAVFNDPMVDADNPALLPGTHKRSLGESVFLGMPDVLYPAPGLGKEAADWFQAARAETQRFLETPPAAAPLTEKKGPLKGIDTYSQVVAAWCARQNREAVMELWPALEISAPRGFSVREALEQPDDWSLSRIFRETDWQIREHNGVAMVKPALAFFFRPRQVPVASLVRLLNAMAERKKQSSTGPAPKEKKVNPTAKDFLPDLPTYSEIEAYTEAAERYRPWGEGELGGIFGGAYYGVNLSNLDAAQPGFFLYRRLTPTQKLKLETGGFLAFSELTPPQRTALASFLQDRYRATRLLLALPNAEQLLNESRLYANLSLRGAKSVEALDFDTDVAWR